MDLKTFVAQSLVEIMEGLREAQEKLQGKSHGRVCPSFDINRTIDGPHVVGKTHNGRVISLVEYDVAVEATSEAGVSGSGGINVLGGILGAKAEGSSRDINKAVSRLKFTVPVSYPDITEQ